MISKMSILLTLSPKLSHVLIPYVALAVQRTEFNCLSSWPMGNSG